MSETFIPIKFLISAPGKVILFGEHSVVYGKPALAASINKRTSLSFETLSSKIVEIAFPDLDWELKLSLEEINDLVRTRSDSGEAALLSQAADDVKKLKNSENFSTNQTTSLKCVFYLLRGLFASQQLSTGFKIHIVSELKIGAGTGSSAAFAVCLAAAFYQYRRFLLAEDNEDLRQFLSKDKQKINEWAFACEQIIHGKASGIDNYVCTYGSVVEVRSNDAGRSKTFEVLTQIPKLRILLINTGVSRNTSALVKKVAELRVSNQTFVDNALNAMEEIVKDARVLLQELNTSMESVENRTYFSQLEELVSMNQGLLSSLGVSHESLDRIVNITKTYNLHSKLTGAGGGGYAITLIPPYAPQEEIQRCVDALEENQFQVNDIIVGDRGVDLQVQ